MFARRLKRRGQREGGSGSERLRCRCIVQQIFCTSVERGSWLERSVQPGEHERRRSPRPSVENAFDPLPGLVWVGATSESTTSYGLATGSSFAAPMIAGALALLGEAFPDLTPHQLRIRLLASADNVFAGFVTDGEVELVEGFSHAISREWGHGFLDVKAALLPIGQTTATMADGSLHDMSEPLVIEGTATGDAVARALRGMALSANDALGTRFALPAETLVARRAQPPLSDDLLNRWQSDTADHCCGISGYFGGTRFLAAGTDTTLVRLMLPGEANDDPSFGAAIERKFESESATIAVSVGLGRDGGDLLPKWSSESGSALLAGALEVTATLASGPEVKFAAGLGGSLDGEASDALLNSATASLVAPDLFRRGDRLTFSVGLPVAVVHGSTSITLPVQTRGGARAHEVIDVELAPENREVRFGVDYRFDVSERSEVVLSAAHAENYGNVGATRSAAVFVGYSTQF